MHWLFILGVALANNLDNLGVGIAYGISGIRLRPLINLWIALITFFITAASIALADRLAYFLPATVTHWVSAAALSGIGLWMILSSRRQEREKDTPVAVRRSALHTILKEPELADRDRSRDIDVREGSLLGLALSINNIGGGFGAGLIHLSALWTAFFSALASFLALWLGSGVGPHLRLKRFEEHAPAVAGAVLIAIGLMQLL